MWGPPAEPNGVITGYQLRFSGISSRTTVNKLPSDSYHVVTEDNIRNLGTDNIQVSVISYNHVLMIFISIISGTSKDIC